MGAPGARFVVDLRPARTGGAALWKVDGRLLEGDGQLVQFEVVAGITDWITLAGSASRSSCSARPGSNTCSSSRSGGEPRRAPVRLGAPHVLGTRPEEERPDVLLVTLDTLRADALGRETPALMAFAAEGLTFEDAWSACNSTLPSHASILTGLAVPTHGVQDNRSRLGASVRTLAQAFADQGYRTGAAVSVHHLEAVYSGLGRGLSVPPGAPRSVVMGRSPSIPSSTGWRRRRRTHRSSSGSISSTPTCPMARPRTSSPRTH